MITQPEKLLEDVSSSIREIELQIVDLIQRKRMLDKISQFITQTKEKE